MQVQQLMEQDLVIRSLFGQNQNRRENTADKCGRNTVQDHRPAGGQTVTGTYVRDLFLLSFRYRTPPAEKQTQEDIREKISRQTEEHAGKIEDKEPVGCTLWDSGKPGDSDAYTHRGKRITKNGGKRCFRRLFGGLQGGRRKSQQIPSEGTRRNQKAEKKHAPDSVLPAGRKFVCQQPFQDQKKKRCPGNFQCL